MCLVGICMFRMLMIQVKCLTFRLQSLLGFVFPPTTMAGDQWTEKCKQQLSRADDCLALIMERNMARKSGQDTTLRYDKRISGLLAELSAARLDLEESLSTLENT
jgi:hypothetical protein